MQRPHGHEEASGEGVERDLETGLHRDDDQSGVRALVFYEPQLSHERIRYR